MRQQLRPGSEQRASAALRVRVGCWSMRLVRRARRYARAACQWQAQNVCLQAARERADRARGTAACPALSSRAPGSMSRVNDAGGLAAVGEHLAPRIDDERVAVRRAVAGMLAAHRGREDEARVLDRARLEQRVPVHFAGRALKRGRNREIQRAGLARARGRAAESAGRSRR